MIESVPQLIGARPIADRYRPDTLLKQSSRGQTLLATDQVEGRPVILRTVAASLAAAVQLRLNHEAAILSKLSSPRLARVLHSGVSEEYFYWTRAHIPGIPLSQYVQQPLPLQDALAVCLQLLTALRELHEAGILCRNLRPSNLIIPQDQPLSAAILTDCGLACSLYSDDIHQHALDDVLYLSPEQAGSLDCEISASSDLYSVGIILFQLLAGHVPYRGPTVGDVLLRHMTAHIPKLRDLGRQVPRALDELISRLLRKDPRDRYQSCEAVIADLTTIQQSCRQGNPEPEFVIGLKDRRGTLTEAAFVGRTHELEQLDKQISRVRLGRPSFIVVETESGGGKSRLLDEVTQRCRQQGICVLRGTGSNQVGLHPFQVLDGVLNGVLAAAETDSQLGEKLRRRLGEHQDAICSALPRLAISLGWEVTENLGPEAFGESRAIQALAHFLDALGDVGRPTLIMLDDCQWADESAIKLITRWSESLAARHEQVGNVALLVAFRSDEVPADALLRSARGTLHLRLSKFDADDIRKLLESMAGPLPESIIQKVVLLADGSPFMASAILRGLVESGALVADQAGWQVEPRALADLQSSHHAASFLSRRIELLPPEAIELLTVGAILGKEFHLHSSIQLAGQDSKVALDAIELARERHLIWFRSRMDKCAFVHDKIREAFLDRLSVEERKELHYRAACLLESSDSRNLFELAYHYDAADKSERALQFAFEAAEQARLQHSLEVAEQQYRIAERGAKSSDRHTQYRILQGLGDVLMLRGRYDNSAELFERAEFLAEAEFDRAEIKGKLGELAFKRGDMETATRYFEQALRLLGKRVPRHFGIFLCLFLWETFLQVAHTLLPKWFLHQKKYQPPPEELLSWRLQSRLAHGYWFVRSKVHVLWAHLRGMNQAERYPPTLELAQAYSEHAPAMTLIPYFRRGMTYAQKSYEIRKAFNDVWGQGQSLAYYSVVLYAGSRYTAAIEKGREAIRLLERTGDFWEVHIARYQVAAALYRIGELQNAIQLARQNYLSGLKLGDEQASGISLDVWSRAACGKLAANIIDDELVRHRPDAQGTAQTMLAEGVRLIAAERMNDAALIFEKALSIAARAGVMNAYIAPNLAWLATARRLEFEHYRGYSLARRKRLLLQAEQAAKKSVRLARKFQNDLPHALRELGIIAMLRGRASLGSALFNESMAVAEKQGAKYEFALTRLVKLQSELDAGIAEAASGLPAAQEEIRAIEMLSSAHDAISSGTPKTSTLSLVDRFDTLLDDGRKIASALSPDTTFAAMEQSAVRLLRGEKALVLTELDNQDGRWRYAQSARLADEVHRPLVDYCLQTGRAASTSDAMPLTDPEGLVIGVADSAVCVPVSVRGQPVACLYVLHRQMRDLFRDDEKRLAEFVATLGGAALENADGFKKLQQLNETLEQRVAERTAAAEAASQAKSQFLATVSHEIRTPMNGILGMTDLALSTSLNSRQKNLLSIVKQSANSLLGLINDLLDFSKIEAGKMELEILDLDVRELIGEALQLRAQAACQKRLELVYHVEPNVPECLKGDPGRLKQTLINLVGNAIKFTEHGEIEVHVELTSQDDNDVELHFSVRDTGIGIPADKLDSIFESFEQADSSTTRKYGGTGLGLSISKQLVALMGGKIWVESQAQCGSTFHFTAKFGTCDSPLPRDSRLESLRNCSILIVDDNATQRKALSSIASFYGMAVTVAEDSKSAIQACRIAAEQGELFELAMIDADLPDAASASLAGKIREIPGCEQIGIIALTEFAEQPEPSSSDDTSRLYWLAKPAKESQFRDTLLSIVAPCEVLESSTLADCADIEPLRILLVEDGFVNREVAIGFLELGGHQITTAENGLEALAALENQIFDVILMDVEMPEMDGLEATREIRKREAQGLQPRTPVIAMTAHAIDQYKDLCRENGMDDYLTKPIFPEDLFAALSRVTGKKGIDCHALMTANAE